ncbi:flagellar basal body P-ring formation chaperone FlgA [Comamonadaceae bacterium M7527]|nr:flagellar basal body P-ring formation chaperone FlgA [Comamonadaceae bacterium M7527]
MCLTTAVQAKTPAEQALAKAVVSWGHTNLPNQPTLTLAALDERIMVPTCERALNVDAPFGQAANLRVRCTQPSWQLFVRTQSAQALAKEEAEPVQAEPAEWVVTANQHLTRGTRLTPAMLSLRPANKQTPTHTALKSLEQAVNAELVRDIAAGSAVRRHDVRAAVLVKRGAMVLMSLGSAGGLQISVRLKAQADARMGEQVKLKNVESGREITAKVIGLNEAVAL